MGNCLVHFWKPRLVLLVILVLTGCAHSQPVEVQQIPVSFMGRGQKPLIQAKLGTVRIEPFSNHVIKSKGFPFSSLRRFVTSTEVTFNDGLRTFLRTPGLFSDSSKNVINVRAEILSWADTSTGAFLLDRMEATVKYEFRTNDGTLILAEKITSRGSDHTLDGTTRGLHCSKKTFSNNIAQLAKILEKKLAKVWNTILDKREAKRHRQQRDIEAKLEKQDSYYRVISAKAMVREIPDADAREVARLPQADLVYVTGSLPSGWLQVSREGKPLGWVHASLLREDFASAPSYRFEESPAVPAPLPAPPASVDVAPLDFGSYHALVVGNNEYLYLPKLRTAINDAQAIASLLQDKYGFKVKLLMNVTRVDILVAINSYRRTLTIHDNLLIYYAGHGWLDKDADQGYWLPVNATRENQVAWVSNSAITSEIRAIQAKHVMIVADSCYSGKLARGLHVTQKTPDYFFRISRKKARVVLSSGGLEPVSDSGGKGNHSVFASAFIDALRENTGIMDGTVLFTRIRRPVMVNSDQTPEYADIRKAGHDGGDFLFIRRKE